jgi:AraC-like DNA-binding protein
MSPSDVERVIVASILEGHRRPRIRDVAAQLHMTATQLRRRLSRLQSTYRNCVRDASLTIAERLLCHGTKVEAAMLLAGLHNRTSFNRQFGRRFGCRPSEYKHRHAGDGRDRGRDDVEPTPDAHRRELCARR